MMPAWFTKLNRRERVLSLLVAGTVFALINLFLWTWLLGVSRGLRTEVAKRQATQHDQSVYLRDAELWSKRQQWLKQHQPAFRGPADASTLLDQVKQTAAKYNIGLENPVIGTGDATPSYQPAFASIDTKSPWPPLVHFLYDLQTPDSFVVFESVRLEVDPTDAAQMRGKFKIARWYAPTGAAIKK